MIYQIEACNSSDHPAWDETCWYCQRDIDDNVRVINVPTAPDKIGERPHRAWCHALCVLKGRTFFSPESNVLVLHHIFYPSERPDGAAVRMHDGSDWACDQVADKVML